MPLRSIPSETLTGKGGTIILQGVVDGRGLFWDVCVGYAGSVHDAQESAS
ncbi:hypothetical protein FQN60_005249 [Etheostoma spectabile]|uniref:Uncharacterized protein n=1 Tax=Etheostoma spectabile TaxID=54343 RepID=A0A5J5C7J2_9PERO|nr:hypothetical protein FQN60_005249 [Etheostoma spectabile]